MKPPLPPLSSLPCIGYKVWELEEASRADCSLTEGGGNRIREGEQVLQGHPVSLGPMWAQSPGWARSPPAQLPCLLIQPPWLLSPPVSGRRTGPASFLPPCPPSATLAAARSLLAPAAAAAAATASAETSPLREFAQNSQGCRSLAGLADSARQEGASQPAEGGNKG